MGHRRVCQTLPPAHLSPSHTCLSSQLTRLSCSHLSLLPAHLSPSSSPVSPPSSPVSPSLTCPIPPKESPPACLPPAPTLILLRVPQEPGGGSPPAHPPTCELSQMSSRDPSPPLSLFSWTNPLPESPVSVLPPAPISCPLEKGFRGRAPHLTVDLGSRKGSQRPPSSPSSPGSSRPMGAEPHLGLLSPGLGRAPDGEPDGAGGVKTAQPTPLTSWAYLVPAGPSGGVLPTPQLKKPLLDEGGARRSLRSERHRAQRHPPQQARKAPSLDQKPRRGRGGGILPGLLAEVAPGRQGELGRADDFSTTASPALTGRPNPAGVTDPLPEPNAKQARRNQPGAKKVQRSVSWTLPAPAGRKRRLCPHRHSAPGGTPIPHLTPQRRRFGGEQRARLPTGPHSGHAARVPGSAGLRGPAAPRGPQPPTSTLLSSPFTGLGQRAGKEQGERRCP